MDPVSLSITGLRAIAEVTTALYDKAKQLEKLRKRESKFALQYKRSVEDLANEAEEIKARLNITVLQGNPRAIAKLLRNEDGADALRKLVTMLNLTRDYLQVQITATTKMLRILKKRKEGNIIGHVTDVLGLEDEEAAFDNVMEDATSSLEHQRSDLRRQYEHFASLYNILSSAPRTPPLSPSPPPRHIEERKDHRRSDIQIAFYNRPFQLTLMNAAAADISRDVDITKGNSESYVTLMEQMGKNWVENNSLATSESSVVHLAELQVSLLEKLLTSIEFELASYSIKASVGELEENATNDLRCTHLALMRSTMVKGIDCIRTKRFSVAFCGMVKAG